MTELALDDAEGMLDLCMLLGDDPVDLFVDGVEFAALRRLEMWFGLFEQVAGVFQVDFRLGYAATASGPGKLK